MDLKKECTSNKQVYSESRRKSSLVSSVPLSSLNRVFQRRTCPECRNYEGSWRLGCNVHFKWFSADLPVQAQLICAPPVLAQSTCSLRGCCWSPQSDTSVPWCFFSPKHGYRVQGSQRSTQSGKLGLGTPKSHPFHVLFHTTRGVCVSQGFEATLKRLPSPSLFGNDIHTVLLTAEYQTQNRFRFKVSPRPLLFKVRFLCQMRGCLCREWRIAASGALSWFPPKSFHCPACCSSASG